MVAVDDVVMETFLLASGLVGTIVVMVALVCSEAEVCKAKLSCIGTLVFED